jgi:hypothetical protein
MCNKHTTQLHRLEGLYMTMYCDKAKSWQWLEKMTGEELADSIVK